MINNKDGKLGDKQHEYQLIPLRKIFNKFHDNFLIN